MNNTKILVGFADDHVMLRKGLIKLVQSFGHYQSVFDVSNGNEVIEQLKKHNLPDILILDVNMEGKGGIETAAWVSSNYPHIKIMALSMYSDDETVLKMVQAGAKGYITKNSDPENFKTALDTLYEKDFYFPDHLSLKIFSGIKNNILATPAKSATLNEREKQFLQLLCQGLSYKEIADQMFLSIRTIDGYRKNLAGKLKVKGKSGLIVYAMNNGIK